MTAPRRVAVMVSGGAAISPFTTPSAGCTVGLSAGLTDTGVREALLAAGVPVYTSPANIGARPVTNDPEPNGFDGQPEQLPADLTVNAVGSIDTAGERLAAFLDYLSAREGFVEVDLVGHSMGGLFSRAAIRVLQAQDHPLRVRSLTTLGTPWLGSFVAEVAGGHTDASVVSGDPATARIVEEFAVLLSDVSEGAGWEVTAQYLAAPGGWNDRQMGVLRDIPVTLIAGDLLQVAGGDPHAFPHDGLVSLRSALAEGLDPAVMQPSASHVLGDVHSLFFADQFGLPWERALTWDPEAMALVLHALEAA